LSECSKINPEIQVFLKPKRKYDSNHNQDYVKQISDWDRKLRNFHILAFDADLYETISSAKLVVAIPFTSAALIAKELEIPVFYFSPDHEISLPSDFNGIPVVRDRDNLPNLLSQFLL
jgi:polysaccharide biosynthesis PFTS motif protein